jgi:hypothetical protein
VNQSLRQSFLLWLMLLPNSLANVFVHCQSQVKLFSKPDHHQKLQLAAFVIVKKERVFPALFLFQINNHYFLENDKASFL